MRAEYTARGIFRLCSCNAWQMQCVSVCMCHMNQFVVKLIVCCLCSLANVGCISSTPCEAHYALMSSSCAPFPPSLRRSLSDQPKEARSPCVYINPSSRDICMPHHPMHPTLVHNRTGTHLCRFNCCAERAHLWTRVAAKSNTKTPACAQKC